MGVTLPALTSSHSSRNNVKEVGMACQNVYKQGRDDSIKAKINIKAMAPSLHLFLIYSIINSIDGCRFRFQASCLLNCSVKKM